MRNLASVILSLLACGCVTSEASGQIVTVELRVGGDEGQTIIFADLITREIELSQRYRFAAASENPQISIRIDRNLREVTDESSMYEVTFLSGHNIIGSSAGECRKDR